MECFPLLERDQQSFFAKQVPFFKGNLFPVAWYRQGIHVPAPHTAAGTMNEEIPAIDRCVTEFAGCVQRLGHFDSLG